MRIRRSASRLLGSAYSASAAPTVGAAPPFDQLPPPHPAPCSAPESRGGPGFSSASASSAEPCELNRSPWDLIADLSLSDQKEEDELVDKYFVNVTTRASWLFSATMPATASTKKKKLPAAAYGDSTQQQRREVVKRAAISKDERREVVKRAAINKDDGETKKKAKAKKEEGQEQGGAARVWMCKKNDGRRWHCNRPVSQPNTLCEYHFVQKRSYLNPDLEFQSVAEFKEAVPAPAPAAASKSSTSNKVLAAASKSSTSNKVQAAASKSSTSNKVQAAASKSSTSNKLRKKKKKPGNDCSATEGFYYYTGFGPFRSKRQCRSSGGMNEPLPAKQEAEEEETPEDADSHPTDVAPEVAELTNQAAACQDVSSCDNDDTAGIAGVDEESSDYEYDGIGIAGCNMNGTVDPQASTGELGKRKAPWKRWRKPVKARSLKSLM